MMQMWIFMFALKLDPFDDNIITTCMLYTSAPSSVFNSKFRIREHLFFYYEQAKLSCEVVMNTHNQTIERQDCYPAVN